MQELENRVTDALERRFRGKGALIKHAVSVGVPWVDILGVLISFVGPMLLQKLGELIEKYRARNAQKNEQPF